MKKILVAFLCLVAQANAALTFHVTSSDTVNCGSATSLDNILSGAGTIMIWVFPTTLGANQSWVGQCTGDNCATSQAIFNNGATLVQLSIPRGTSNFSLQSTYGAGNALPTLLVNTWGYFAASFDTAGTNGQQQLWGGSRTVQAVEATGYTNQLVGSGTVTSQASGNFMIGGRPSLSVAMIGRIGMVHVVNTRLTVGQIRAQQFAPHPISGSVLFVRLGFNGTSTQADWSGSGNNCTVTGATQSADMPIAPFSAFLRRAFPMLPAWWLP